MISLRAWCCAMCVLALLETNAFSGSCLDHIDCDDKDSCTYDLCVDGACTNTPARFGDVSDTAGACGPNGVVDLSDIITVMDGVGGNAKAGACPHVNVDMAGPSGCGPDGAKDLYDLFAVLDAFHGIERCCQDCSQVCLDGLFCNGAETCEGSVGCRIDSVPCPGQLCDEDSDSCTAAEAIVTCQLSRDRALPGEPFTLDLFLQNVDELRGYQLGIDIARTAGTGEILCPGTEDRACVFVDQFEREDYVFYQLPTTTVGHASELRIVNMTATGDVVDVGVTPAYLGTYAFTVSADATLESTFELSVRPGGVLLSNTRVPIGFIVDSSCVLQILPPADCDDNGIDNPCELDCGPAGGVCDVPGCGLGLDCNGNDIPDDCDIADGVSQDCPDPACGPCKPNGVPDECEAGDFRIFFVPAGDDPADYASGPTEFNAFGRNGQTISMEVFVEGVPDPIRGIELGFPCIVPGSASGSIEYIVGSGFINQFREDYIYFDVVGSAAGVSECQPDLARAAMGVPAGEQALVCGTKYLFNFDLMISADAAGIFTIEFDESNTNAADENTQALPGLVRESLIIDLDPPDCDGNGIHDACDLDCGPTGGECDVAGCGGASDCNGNQVPDACDVADGDSGDCTGNGVPDECEADCDGNGVADVCDAADCGGNPDCDDCNGNGVLDFCDIVAGDSVDLDNNGVPDECNEPTDATRLFMVRQGLDPTSFPSGRNVVNLQNGESITFDIWVQNTGVPLRAYEIQLDDATGGQEGFLRYDRSPAITNPFLDETRADWVHFGQAAFTATTGEPAARLLSAMTSGGVVVTDPKYCGEITYTADADACGNFFIDFVDPGTIQGVSKTVLVDPDSNTLGFVADGVEVRVGTEVFGDVDASGRVDLFDILCVLDGFGNKFDACTLEAVDLMPCDIGNGIVDLRDILAVIDAFEGLPAPCSSGSCGAGGEAAEAPQRPMRKARLARRSGPVAVITIEPRRAVIGAGEVVAVDVFAARLHDVRGYQLALDVDGGERGQLQLVDMAIESDRTDHLFHGRTSYTAIDLARHRMAQALSEGGVDAARPRYLGTYIFRTSRGARGTFHLTLRGDDTTMIEASGREMSPRLRARASILVR